MTGFVPPPYPYDRLDRLKPLAERFDGGLVDLSIGTPCDPPDEAVLTALASSGTRTRLSAERRLAGPARSSRERGSSAASTSQSPDSQIGAVVGTKEFVGTLPQWIRLRDPSETRCCIRPSPIPTYAMGATFAGCRPVAVPVDDLGRLDLGAIAADDAVRALAALDQLAEQSDRPSRRPGRRGSVGTPARRPGVQRRVLRRVHLDGRAGHDPPARPRRCRRRALAVETIEPGRAPRRVLRR